MNINSELTIISSVAGPPGMLKQTANSMISQQVIHKWFKSRLKHHMVMQSTKLIKDGKMS